MSLLRKLKQNKKLLIIIGIIIFLTVLVLPYLVNINTYYSFQTIINPLNKNCKEDADCVLKDESCYRCDCGPGVAVNRKWKKFCPLGEIGSRCSCVPMPPHNAECINGTCKAVRSFSNISRIINTANRYMVEENISGKITNIKNTSYRGQEVKKVGIDCKSPNDLPCAIVLYINNKGNIVEEMRTS